MLLFHISCGKINRKIQRMNSVCWDPYKNNSEQMQASWKIRPMLVVVKVLPGGFKPCATLDFRCTQVALQSGGVLQLNVSASINWWQNAKHTRSCSDQPEGLHLIRQKMTSLTPCPSFPTSTELNDASFAESCCLGFSGILPDTALILTPPLPPKLDAKYTLRENWWGKVSYIFQWVAPYFVFSVY